MGFLQKKLQIKLYLEIALLGAKIKLECQKDVCSPLFTKTLFTQPNYGINPSVHQHMNG